MKLYLPILAALSFIITLSACNNNKPKPVSADVTKQTVRVNGQKDSVINNSKKNYGNATVSEPCVRCLIQAIQSTDSYKQTVGSADQKNIKYKINWVKADGTVDTANSKGATNALRIDVSQNNSSKSSFVYENSSEKLFLVTGKDLPDKKEAMIDQTQLKKIRNACYWGVASGK